MIDFHTHILPGMDDGSSTPEMSLQMLASEAAQGVHTVVLTPHFYRQDEDPARFLQRRTARWDVLQSFIQQLPTEEAASLPRLTLGAEVAWVPNLAEWPELPQLCLGNSAYMLLELPFIRWNSRIIQQVYDIQIRTGITPILAHLERYRSLQDKGLYREVFTSGLPIQIGCDFISSDMWTRRAVLKMLKTNDLAMLASDAHNLSKRPPNMGTAVHFLEKKLGTLTTKSIQKRTENLLSKL